MSAEMTTAEYARAVERAMPEKVFMARVVGIARMFGYRTYHTHFSFRSDAGYPDLHVVKGPRSVFAELKTERGKVTPAQEEWLAALREAGHEAYCWRPSHLDEIVRVLGGER